MTTSQVENIHKEIHRNYFKKSQAEILEFKISTVTKMKTLLKGAQQ